ncbi:hypothetical protein E2C01_012573 [Portunus trituberculatus]|uniref:Uncharacterized protein n=1 Tax=Portunus trituberculatus TaxID=210409 RepID=A0A5B7DEK5_PORTR|nr:hypothetical protein [Portunus trituberculatus]
MPPDKHERDTTFHSSIYRRHSIASQATWPFSPLTTLPQDMPGHMALPTPPQQDTDEYFTMNLK